MIITGILLLLVAMTMGVDSINESHGKDAGLFYLIVIVAGSLLILMSSPDSKPLKSLESKKTINMLINR